VIKMNHVVEADDAVPKRPTGDAAWKAHRDAIEQRNAAARKAAKPQSAAERASMARERRLEQIENDQLRKLNDSDDTA
jgi:hypothetical protein